MYKDIPIERFSVRSTYTSRSSFLDVDPAELATFRAERISSALVLIAVRGELDLSTTPSVRSFLDCQLVEGRKYVLDFSAVDFIGTDGLSVLFAMDAHCGGVGEGWALVTSRAVRCLLRATELESRFPAFESTGAAIASLRGAACGSEGADELAISQ
ncbi:MAG: STAS domain-containing protein [Candidatus Solibacter usitatus]|nr:STAS domain-containing protein [Candidatus Solibacter usitatus]